MQGYYAINSGSLMTYKTVLLWRTADPVTLNNHQFIMQSTWSSYLKWGRNNHEWIPNKYLICTHRLLINKTNSFSWNELWTLGLETSYSINMQNATSCFKMTIFLCVKLELRSLVTFFSKQIFTAELESDMKEGLKWKCYQTKFTSEWNTWCHHG